VSVVGTGTRASQPGELHRRRVVLLAESASLAAVVNHLLDPADRLSRLGSLHELADSRALDSADVVVLDVPVAERATAVGLVRRRFLGPLVVIVARGEKVRGLRLDDASTVLFRPFSAVDLGAALVVPGHPPASPRAAAAAWGTPLPPAGLAAPGMAPIPPVAATAPSGAWFDPTDADAPPGAPPETLAASTGAGAPAVDPKAAARQAPVRRAPAVPPGQIGPIEWAQRQLVTLTQGWQARRRVRVAGFSFVALVAFTVAFAFAAQGRCGPGCDAFGTVFSPEPTIAPTESRAPSTTGPKRSTTTTAPAGSPGAGAFGGIAGGAAATTTTTEQRVTATTRTATTRTATTRPATTRPATTQTTTPTTTPTTAPSTTVTTVPPVT
jgi:hypothetical protein